MPQVGVLPLMYMVTLQTECQDQSGIDRSCTSAEGAAEETVAERGRNAREVDEEPASSSGDEDSATDSSTRQAPKHIDESDPERASYHRYSSQQYVGTHHASLSTIPHIGPFIPEYSLQIHAALLLSMLVHNAGRS